MFCLGKDSGSCLAFTLKPNTGIRERAVKDVTRTLRYITNLREKKK